MHYSPYYTTVTRAGSGRELKCSKCGCHLMEERRYGRFRGDITTIVGTPVPLVENETHLYIYVCALCGWPEEQPLQFLVVDAARQDQAVIIQHLQEQWLATHKADE